MADEKLLRGFEDMINHKVRSLWARTQGLYCLLMLPLNEQDETKIKAMMKVTLEEMESAISEVEHLLAKTKQKTSHP